MGKEQQDIFVLKIVSICLGENQDEKNLRTSIFFLKDTLSKGGFTF